jgi:flagellar hook-associated protein 3 FlgL
MDWVDDEGRSQHKEVELRNGGESGRVNIPELGPDFYLYRDNQTFTVGATFEIKLSYLNGNSQELETMYADNNNLRYNWNAWQVLGDNLRVDLRGMETVPRSANNGNGLISLSGFYHGLYPQYITFDIMEDGTLDAGQVKVRASWIDANGQAQQQTLVLNNSGAGGGAVLPILGYPPTVDLNEVQAVKTGGATGPFSGQLVMAGKYTGLTSCDFGFTISAGGVLNSDNVGNTPVSAQVTWIDDQGVPHSDELTFNSAGPDYAQEIPGAGGLSFYLQAGDYTAADTYQQSITMSPEYANEGFFFQLEPGAYQAGDSFFISIPTSSQHVLDTLNQWLLALESGDQEMAQTWSQRALEDMQKAQEQILDFVADSGARQNRILGRTAVLDSQEIFNSETLVTLQELNATTTLLDMQQIMSAYTNTLKVISQVSDLFILNYL